MRRSVDTLCVSLILLAFATSSPARAAGDQFRRWISPKPYSCSSASGGVLLALANQNVEFRNLPVDAQFTINYIRNGVFRSDGPYPVEQVTGTRNYAGFSESFSAYPVDFAFQLDTLIDGTLVYRSTLPFDCNRNESGSVEAIDVDYGPPATRWRRWSLPKSFTCAADAEGVALTLDNQNVEFNELPPDAQFTINYDRNGEVTSDGPFTVEQTSGSRSYGGFLSRFEAYPVRFNFRLDTLIDGVVVYESTLLMHCDEDSTGTATPIGAQPFALFADGFE